MALVLTGRVLHRRFELHTRAPGGPGPQPPAWRPGRVPDAPIRAIPSPSWAGRPSRREHEISIRSEKFTGRAGHRASRRRLRSHRARRSSEIALRFGSLWDNPGARVASTGVRRGSAPAEAREGKKMLRVEGRHGTRSVSEE